MNTDKLRELLAKATPGPWLYESLTAGHAICSGEAVVAFCGPKNPDDSGYARNADLIAAMHESLPGLLSEIDRLTGELDRLRKDADWQAIETAPHTGIAVLLWQPWKSGRDCTVIGHYANGWCGRDCEDLQPEPTHWMPLPAPPAIDAAVAAQEG